jgi:hypothetical protein
VNLRNSQSLCCSPGSACVEGATLLWVAEVLNLEDLCFPVLLDEREDADGIVIARGTVDEREHGSALRHVHIFWSDTL